MVQFNSSKIVQKYTKICAEKFLLRLLDKLLIYKQTLSIRKYRTDSNFTTKIMHMNIFTSKKVMRKRHGKFGQLLFDFLITSKYRAILLLLNSIRSLFELWWNILPRVWLDFNVRQTNYDVNWYPNLSKHLNFRLFSVDCTCSYKNIHRTYIIRNLWKYKPDLLGTLCRAALENLKFYNKKFGSLAIFRSIINNRAFSLTWLADMRIYWNKRKCLLKKKVYPP